MRKSIFNAAAVLGAVSASITAAAFYLLNYFDVGGAVTAIAILAVIIIAAVAAANQIAKSITGQVVSQLADIDLENIGDAEVCVELKPFLERIEEENLGKEKSEQMRREFSANVSHELKTPLTSISGYAQMINNGMAKEEDFLTFTRRIEKEASRLILLINDIIKLSNLDEQNGAPEAQKIDLSIAAQETIVELEKAANDKNVRIFYSGKETYINGSRTLIGELMYNLIDNAIKYNHDGGQITVFVGRGADGAVFSVKDTGIGIPDEDLDRVFERFYRVDKSHSKTVGGTGLGLSIVKHVAICHNARIDVKSKVGSGTTISAIFEEA